jgi:hypothetical protein
LRNYSFETVRVWREYFSELERERETGEALQAVCRQFVEQRCAGDQCRARMIADCGGLLPERSLSIPEGTTFHVAHLSFDLAEEATARRLSSVPTSLSLSDEEADFLIAEGRRTRFRSMELLRFLNEMERAAHPADDDKPDGTQG